VFSKNSPQTKGKMTGGLRMWEASNKEKKKMSKIKKGYRILIWTVSVLVILASC